MRYLILCLLKQIKLSMLLFFAQLLRTTAMNRNSARGEGAAYILGNLCVLSIIFITTIL